MTLDADNPHGFGWEHDNVNQYLVIGDAKIHIAWLMPRADLRAALAGHNIVDTIIDAAVQFVEDHRPDFDVSQQAKA